MTPDPPRPLDDPAADPGVDGGGCEIVFQNPSRYPEAGARRLGPWLSRLVGALAPEADSLAVRFTSDREMRRLNRSWRGRDYPTDVLSFPGEETPEGHHLGDLVISVPTARRQAEELGHGVDRELRVLLLHGVLHCLGHDHEDDDGAMARLEADLVRRWIDPAGDTAAAGSGGLLAGEAEGVAPDEPSGPGPDDGAAP